MSKKIFLCILVITSLFLFNFIFIANDGKIPMTAPDEETTFFFSNNLIQNGDYLWRSELNSIYNVPYFRPRGAIEFEPNLYSPMTSLTFVTLSSMAKLFGFYYILVSIFALIGIIFIFLITRELFNSEKCGIVAASLTSLFPVYIIYANSLFDIIPTIVAWLGAVFLYLKFIKTNKWKYLYFVVLIALLAVNLRPDAAILFIPFLFFHLIKYRSVLKSKKFIFLLLFLLFAFLLFFGQNKITYDSFFASGRELLTSRVAEGGSTGFIKEQLLKINPFGLTLAIKNYFFPYIPILIFGILGLSLLYIKDDRNLKQIFFVFLILIVIVLIFYTSSVPSYLTSKGVRSSASRHFLPIYLILMILFSRFFKHNNIIKGPKIAVPIILLVIITTLFNYGVNAPSGSLLAVYERTARLDTITSQLNEIKQESIIITNYLSYVVTPTKHNIMLVYEKHHIIGAVYEVLYTPIKNRKELAQLTEKLLDDNWDVFISKSGYLNEVTDFLRRDGFILKDYSPSFYKILLPSSKPLF